MKTLIQSVFTLSTIALMGASAQADFVPGRERPAVFGEAQILQADGIYKNTKAVDVTLLSKDEVRDYTGVVLTVDGQRTRFEVQSVTVVGCGSTKIVAVAKKGLAPREDIAAEVEILDHSTRLCDDYRRYVWDVTVRPHNVRIHGLLELGVARPEHFMQTLSFESEPKTDVLPFDQN